jgi:hypothetical protein
MPLYGPGAGLTFKKMITRISLGVKVGQGVELRTLPLSSADYKTLVHIECLHM